MVPTVPTAETSRNELCALVTTAHLHCMRTGKCHLNLAYLGSGVCVKNAHHMFCVTSHVLCSPSSLPITLPSPRYAKLWNLILCLPLVPQHCEMGEGCGEGTAPTLLGRICDIRKCYMTSRVNWMSVFYADPGIRFCCFGDHVVYTYHCFAETRLV